MIKWLHTIPVDTRRNKDVLCTFNISPYRVFEKGICYKLNGQRLLIDIFGSNVCGEIGQLRYKKDHKMLMKLKEYTNLTLTLISPISIYYPHPQKPKFTQRSVTKSYTFSWLSIAE